MFEKSIFNLLAILGTSCLQGYSSFLAVTKTTIISLTISNFGQIGTQTVHGAAARECLKKFPESKNCHKNSKCFNRMSILTCWFSGEQLLPFGLLVKQIYAHSRMPIYRYKFYELSV